MRSLVRPTPTSAPMMPHVSHRIAGTYRVDSAVTPPWFMEYAYFATVTYGSLGTVLGLYVRFLEPALLLLLAVWCLARLGPRALSVYAPMAFPLACALSLLIIQLVVHGESIVPSGVIAGTGGELRVVIVWILGLFIIQSLVMRQGFLHRFALVSFVTGLGLLPFIKFYGYSTTLVRIGLEGVGRDNPNALGMWAGFCAVYFFVAGIEARRTFMRVAAWLAGVGCLYMVGITVSRGPLLGTAVATTMALRRLLKRGTLPLLLLLGLSWMIYTSGLFEPIATFYAYRGLEESGRGLTLPIAIDRFLQTPLTGVGISHVTLYVPSINRFLNPHNSFLYIGIMSGVIPLAFFLAYWGRAALGVLQARAKNLPDAPFLLPLLVYAFLEAMILDLAFMSNWHMVVLAKAVAVYTPRRAKSTRAHPIPGVENA